MRVVIDPELPPNVLNHRAVVIANHGPVLPNEDEPSIEQEIIDIVDDPGCAVVAKRTLASLTLAPGKGNAAEVMDVDSVP